MSEKFPITVEGFERLEKELKELKTTKRAEISQKIAAAREHGDLKENAEYHAAREEQSFMEGRVLELEGMLARAEIIDISQLDGNTVKFGAKVCLFDVEAEKEVTYRIVSEYEADIEKNLISIASPLARALIGKAVDDSVEVRTPRGSKEYELISLEFK